MRVLKATFVEGKLIVDNDVGIGSILQPNILSNGNADSVGYVVIDNADYIYIANTINNINETLDKVKETLDLVKDLADTQVSKDATTLPLVNLSGTISTQVNTLLNDIDILKENLQWVVTL